MKLSDIPKFYIFSIIIGGGILVYFFSFSDKISKDYKLLDQEGVIDTAVIVRDFIGSKGRLYYEYQFQVKTNVYNGFLNYSPSHGDIFVNDSCLVKYLPSDPDEINELVQNENLEIVVIDYEAIKKKQEWLENLRQGVDSF